LSVAFHPIEYAKVLMQLGYEPIPPTRTRTLFGRPALALPNVLQYISYIKQEDGFLGCYRGLAPRLCYNFVSSMTYQKTLAKLNENEEDNENEKDKEDLPLETYVIRVLKDMMSRVAAIVISHPFHVITVRTMAQFVGKEVKYTGVLHAVGSIYDENGVSGYFQGLVPRVFGEVLAIAISSSLTYGFRTYLIEDKEIKSYLHPAMMFIANAVTYPFQAVSTCMTVNKSGLAISYPPHMPIYNNWTDCWTHLSKTNQLKRGSGIFWRYYTGPQVLLDGKVIIVDPVTFNYPVNTSQRYRGS